MNQAYIIPFLVSTVVHGAALYSFASHVIEPKVFVPQSVTALEFCIEGSSVPDQMTLQSETKTTKTFEKEESALSEEIKARPQEKSEDVPLTREPSFHKACSIEDKNKRVSLDDQLFFEEEDQRSFASQGNSEITNVGETGSENGFREPELVYNPAPKYPRSARQKGEEGMVVISVFITEKGEVQRAHILSSSGFDRLDEAALNVVRLWRFSPALKNGSPYALERSIPFVFKLK
jgi:TonB family protein